MEIGTSNHHGDSDDSNPDLMRVMTISYAGPFSEEAQWMVFCELKSEDDESERKKVKQRKVQDGFPRSRP